MYHPLALAREPELAEVHSTRTLYTHICSAAWFPGPDRVYARGVVFVAPRRRGSLLYRSGEALARRVKKLQRWRPG